MKNSCIRFVSLAAIVCVCVTPALSRADAVSRPSTGTAANTSNVAVNPVIKKYVDECWSDAGTGSKGRSVADITARATLLDLQKQERLSDVQLAEQIFLVLVGRMDSPNSREETAIVAAQLVNFTQFGLGKPIGPSWFDAIAPYLETDTMETKAARDLGIFMLRAGMMLAPSPWGTEFQRDNSSLDELERYLRNHRPEDHVNLIAYCFRWSPRATLRSVVAQASESTNILFSCDELDLACRSFEHARASGKADEIAAARSRVEAIFDTQARAEDWRVRAYAAARLDSAPYLRSMPVAKLLRDDKNRIVAKIALDAIGGDQ